MTRIVSTLFIVFFVFPLLAQNTFECNAKLLLSQYSGGAPTNLSEIEVQNGVALFQLVNTHQVVYNSSGYNRTDNLIYGFEPGPREVYRIFSDNTFQSLGTIPGLPGGLVAGDCDSSGNYILGGSDGSLHFIDVTGGTASLMYSVPLSYASPLYTGVPRFIDFAFHPKTQVLWSYDNNTQRVVNIDPVTGVVTIVGMQQPGYALGAMFFNALSQLFAYDQSNLYQINLTSGQISFVATGPSGSGRDGCSCPYTVQLAKTAIQDAVCPGDTVDYQLVIGNLTGASMSGVTLIDSLPSNMTLVSVSNMYSGTFAPGTGIGTSNLVITNMTISNGDNQLQVSVVVDSNFSGGVNLLNQAKVTDLSVVSADTIYSDDPTTADLGDSTSVFIYPKKDPRQAIGSNGNICPGDTLSLIGLSDPNSIYNWYYNDSLISTNKNLFLNGLYDSDTGLYSLQILENGCTNLEDSVRIDFQNCDGKFNCTNPFLLSHGTANTQIGQLAYNTTFQLPSLMQSGVTVNAMGYHPKDNYIYGIRQPGNQLVRLYANGNTTILPLPAGVPQGVQYIAGDIDSAGDYTITSDQGDLVQLKVDQKTPALLTTQTLSYNGNPGTPYFGDIAFHPLSNRLYGFDTVTQKMATIDPTNGWVDTFGLEDTLVHIEGLFFNNFGRLYGYGDSSLYRIQPNSGEVFWLTNGTASGIIDGCVCPDGLAMEKTVPDPLCEEAPFWYMIHIQNNTGAPQQVFQIRDFLDPQLEIIDTVNPLTGTIPGGTGIGTNRFLIYQTTIPEGRTTIEIQVAPRPSMVFPDTIFNQSFIETNNTFLGDTIFSDDPRTGYILDRTTAYIGIDDSVFIDTTICSPDSIVIFNCGSYKETGFYTPTRKNSYGCTTHFFLDLTVYDTQADTVEVSICQGDQYYAGGQWQTQSGVYTDSLQNVNGCDSVIVTDLRVLSTLTNQQNVSICDGDSYMAAGALQTQAGTYYDTLSSHVGCDSIVITQLSIIQPSTSSTTLSICAGDSVFVGGAWQSTAGSYADTLVSSIGCDSIVTTQLSLIQPITTTENIVLCTGDSLFVGGDWQTTNGTYIDTLTATNGCDSIRTTQLSFNTVITAQSRADICTGDSVFAAGAWQTQPGFYRDTTVSQLGCDSIHTLELVVHPDVTTNQNITLCQGDSLFVGGTWQTQSGTYTDTYATIWGCDSVVTTTLQFNATFLTSLTESICQGESIVFGGQSYSTSGTYFDTLTAATGCDSVIALTLTVLSLPQPELGPDTTICSGETIALSPGVFAQYAWQDGTSNSSIVVDQAGTYSVTVTDNNGCQASDSRTINLQPLPAFTLGRDTTFCPGFSFDYSFSLAGATYVWQDGSTQGTFQVDQPGQYWLQVTVNNCARTDTINIDTYVLEPLSLPPDTLICLSDEYIVDVTQPNGASYQWSHGPTTPMVTLEEAMTYEVIITDVNGCQQAGFITLEKEYCPPSIRWPSAFSPNGDGQNDLFQLQTELVDIQRVQIFNRWGGLVFESAGNQPWDGTYNGQPAQMGTYIVVVQYLDETGVLLQRQANLTLLR